MPSISKILIAVAGLAHVLFFLVESVFFMNEKVFKVFGAADAEQAAILQTLAYNQGWYNLFLAIAAWLGLALIGRWKANVGETLAVYASLSMVGAGLILLFSTGKLLGTAVQAGIPALALLIYFVSLSRDAATPETY
jgi:putative membrane protein